MGHVDDTMLRRVYDRTDENDHVRAARARYLRDHATPGPAKATDGQTSSGGAAKRVGVAAPAIVPSSKFSFDRRIFATMMCCGERVASRVCEPRIAVAPCRAAVCDFLALYPRSPHPFPDGPSTYEPTGRTGP